MNGPLDALSDVIYHLETYDVTTIRASTPMFLLARRIKATGKVIYPKYYKNQNESCTFAFFGRLGRQNSTDFFFYFVKSILLLEGFLKHIFTGKKTSQAEFLYIVGVRTKK